MLPQSVKSLLGGSGGARWLRRGEPGYEQARRATSWNARLPARHHDVIVRARSANDVIEAVRFARSEGLRIGVRSGGHGWSANHVRDGGLLLDVSALDEVTIDKRAMRATAGPGRRGDELSSLLSKERLFFPTGHCRGVGIGGYLLQGGFGWHGRVLGLACESVEALDVVTAEGEPVHASPTENDDLYWAARGAGCGFFGVVTRFHLRLYDKPRTIGFALQTFSLTRLEEVFRWAREVSREVPECVELQLLMNRGGITVVAPVFTQSWREALRALSFMNRSAIRHKARLRIPWFPSGLKWMYRGVMSH